MKYRSRIALLLFVMFVVCQAHREPLTEKDVNSEYWERILNSLQQLKQARTVLTNKGSVTAFCVCGVKPPRELTWLEWIGLKAPDVDPHSWTFSFANRRML